MDTFKRLDDLIEGRNMSLWQLAKASGINYNTLKHVRSRGSQLSVDMIDQICGTLGIKLEDFFSDREPQFEDVPDPNQLAFLFDDPQRACGYGTQMAAK